MTVHSGPDIRKLTAADVMQSAIITVGERTPLSEVARVLTDNRISGVPVTNSTGHIVGVVSAKDLVDHFADEENNEGGGGSRRGGYYDAVDWDVDDEYLLRERPEYAEDVASDVMNGDVFAVERGTPLPKVARQMVDRGMHRVLVQHDNKFLGIVTTFDILRALAE